MERECFERDVATTQNIYADHGDVKNLCNRAFAVQVLGAGPEYLLLRELGLLQVYRRNPHSQEEGYHSTAREDNKNLY